MPHANDYHRMDIFFMSVSVHRNIWIFGVCMLCDSEDKIIKKNFFKRMKNKHIRFKCVAILILSYLSQTKIHRIVSFCADVQMWDQRILSTWKFSFTEELLYCLIFFFFTFWIRFYSEKRKKNWIDKIRRDCIHILKSINGTRTFYCVVSIIIQYKK